MDRAGVELPLDPASWPDAFMWGQRNAHMLRSRFWHPCIGPVMMSGMRRAHADTSTAARAKNRNAYGPYFALQCWLLQFDSCLTLPAARRHSYRRLSGQTLVNGGFDERMKWIRLQACGRLIMGFKLRTLIYTCRRTQSSMRWLSTTRPATCSSASGSVGPTLLGIFNEFELQSHMNSCRF